MVHLTMRGYKLKGQLLADALLKTLSLYKNRDSLLYNTDSLKIHHPVYQAANAIVARTPVYIAKANTGQPAGKTGVIRHKILPGENLGSIARKYHVTVKEIQNLNGKNNTMIIAGRTLLIPVH